MKFILIEMTDNVQNKFQCEMNFYGDTEFKVFCKLWLF